MVAGCTSWGYSTSHPVTPFSVRTRGRSCTPAMGFTVPPLVLMLLRRLTGGDWKSKPLSSAFFQVLNSSEDLKLQRSEVKRGLQPAVSLCRTTKLPEEPLSFFVRRLIKAQSLFLSQKQNNFFIYDMKQRFQVLKGISLKEFSLKRNKRKKQYVVN